MDDVLWGIDLGGTKIEGVILPQLKKDSVSTPTPVCRKRISTESEKGYDHILHRITVLVAELKQESGLTPKRIGFGTPGTLDPVLKTLKNSNTQCMNGMPLRADLERLLQVETRLANDANCFALAEATFGAGRGAHTVFGVILGTGVGGGIVVDGKVLHGKQGIAGEWGHNVVDPGGPRCFCGKSGCVEQTIAGPSLERYYRSLSNERLQLSEICERAKSGNDQVARQTLERLTEYFGRAISMVVNILDPDVVVLGGGVSNIEELYTSGREALTRNVFNNRLETEIRKNELGDSAGVFGAAGLLAKI